MDKSAIDLLVEYFIEEKNMDKLSNDINFRRIELMLLREIVLELRKLNEGKVK